MIGGEVRMEQPEQEGPVVLRLRPARAWDVEIALEGIPHKNFEEIELGS